MTVPATFAFVVGLGQADMGSFEGPTVAAILALHAGCIPVRSPPSEAEIS